MTEQPESSELDEGREESVQSIFRRFRRRLIAVLAAAVVVVGGGVAALVITLGGQETFTVRGTLTIYGVCGYGTGYSDLTAGAQVVVYDSDRTVLGTGTLVSAIKSRGRHMDGVAGCTYTFKVQDVPAGLERYGVHIGNSNRGVIWASERDARNGFSLSIG